ncbi:MAG: T9SS type A sorting domain-containing protein [bacterium]|nr:T9SS type A sorting domain-containing protein [bacterium]
MKNEKRLKFNRTLVAIFCCLWVSNFAKAQVPKVGDSLQIEIANWNLNWLGKKGYGPSNELLQQKNIIDVIRASDIDIWTFCEVSDELVFDSMLQQLPEYKYKICNYLPEQKTAVVYKKSMFTLIKSELIGTQQKDSFSTLRFPFEVALKPLIPMGIDTLYLIAIHLKANFGTSSELLSAYNSRIRSGQWLKMYLNKKHRNDYCILLGDWNDDIDESIYNSLPSPFAPMLDANFDFTFLTQIFTNAHIGTTTNYPDAIDHQLISNRLKKQYVLNSTKLFTLNQYIANFSTTTSDHYPVYSSFTSQMSKINNFKIGEHLILYLNADRSKLTLEGAESNGQFRLYNNLGQCVINYLFNSNETFDISALPQGIYTAEINTDKGYTTIKVAF